MKIHSILILFFLLNLFSLNAQISPRAKTSLQQTEKKYLIPQRLSYSDKDFPLEEQIKDLDPKRQKVITLYSDSTFIPSYFWNIKNVLKLELYLDEIKSLPAEIGMMKDLRELVLNCDKLEFIPDEFGNLKKLGVLEIRSKADSLFFPKSIEEINKLEYISISNPNLKKINGSFFKSNRMYYFGLICKNLIAFPKNIYTYTSIKEISIEGNFTEISENIGNFSELREIKFSFLNKDLKPLPENIFNFPKATSFRLTIRNEKNLPKKITNLNSLKRLALRVPDIKKLPEGIQNSLHLESLEISLKDLEQLPSELSQLEKSPAPELGSSPLETVPSFNFKSNSIDRMEITGNKHKPLKSISVNQFPNLTTLVALDVHMNIEDFSKCKKLETIALVRANWTSMPEELLEFKNLDYLYLVKNKIKTLPSFIGQFNEKLLIILDSNPISEKSKEIDLSKVKAKIEFFLH